MNISRPAADPPDEELAALAAAGSRAAFEELVSRYAIRLFHFLRRRSASAEDAEDIVQEALLRAYRSMGRYDARWKFSTWLYTLAERLAISRRRALKIRAVALDRDRPQCSFPGPQEILAQKEEEKRLHDNVWNLARTLRPGEFDALWLRYAEGMPVKDIAKAMGKTQIGVRALLHRSRLKLGKKLGSPKEQAATPETAPAVHRFSVP